MSFGIHLYEMLLIAGVKGAPIGLSSMVTICHGHDLDCYHELARQALIKAESFAKSIKTHPNLATHKMLDRMVEATKQTKKLTDSLSGQSTKEEIGKYVDDVFDACKRVESSGPAEEKKSAGAASNQHGFASDILFDSLES